MREIAAPKVSLDHLHALMACNGQQPVLYLRPPDEHDGHATLETGPECFTHQERVVISLESLQDWLGLHGQDPDDDICRHFLPDLQDVVERICAEGDERPHTPEPDEPPNGS
ncbi:hypothetical protein ACFY1P_20710 [Streptomyces sp. NPDC001407]|uniref:hypothetical protein n=1 Tax=Streptomyces sp. NPDC001407 TaxID=3364573 RepID=UPI0036C1BD73